MSEEDKIIEDIVQNVISCTYAVQTWLERDPDQMTLKEAYDISWHMEHNKHIWDDLTKAAPINDHPDEF